ncbi:MAG: hypothetical protein KDC44_00650 [Phaeodactylibacter sp.]|nr:hypothetical protein [Phaeodactylibacter sp.]
MKYRRLDSSELEEVQASFVRFLASHQITSQDWEKLKADKTPKVDALIEQFSDLVFERVLSEVEYLEFKSPDDIKTFHCAAEKITLLGIQVSGESRLDFTQTEAPELMLKQLYESGAQLRLYAGEKAYSKARNLELFDMMENGAKISKDGLLFKTLKALQPS